jgi:hypothetical protein
LLQVEQFVADLMHNPDPVEGLTKLKFLLAVFLPLRAPSKYGLSATQGLQVMAKVFTSTADCYAGEHGHQMEETKEVWMAGFADAALAFIQDEDLLKGMLMEAPDKSAVEALASTELMSAILNYKFLSGPVIVFYVEAIIFTLMFTTIIWQASLKVPIVPATAFAMISLLYFTVRELHQMYTARQLEMMTLERTDALAVLSHPALQPASVLAAQKDDDWLRTFTYAKFSRFLTVNMGMAVAWRSDAFSWVDLASIITGWPTLILLLVDGSLMLADENRDENDHVTQSKVFNWWQVILNVLCVFFLWLKLLGYLKGTTKKMATFVLMLQEIISNIDAFMVVLCMIIVMFASLYHLLLKNNAAVDDDEYGSFFSTLWKVMMYSVGGDLDDTAFPTAQAHFLFIAMVLCVVIIMMNILIAIVSDSYTDAMARSGPLFWRARVDLIAELEPLLPKYQEEDDFTSLMDEETKQIFLSTKVELPNTWQYHCLMFQESMVATTIVCGLVLFELLYVSNMQNTPDPYSPMFFGGLCISLFFLFEICLRFYTWWHSFRSWHDTALGGFFTNPFRLMDTVLVAIDVTILTLTFSLQASGGSATDAKAAVKLTRLVRFARSARWLRGTKALRSCKFLAKLANQWRKYARPTKESLCLSIADSLADLEDKSNWAGRCE